MVDINKKKILGRGATATIFEAKKGSTLYAAKIFHPGTKVNVEKIEAMMKNPPKIKSMKIDGLPFLQFAWPIELIKSNNTDVIGFLMPLINLKNSFSLDFFYDAVLFHKLKSSNEVALTFKLAIAKNLAKVVADLHADNHFFIDLKPQNIRVAKGTHAVTLLDCDGFSIASKNGKRFPAELISTDYIAPEVTNKNESPVNLGEEQDLYALAVIIFQLLNKGTHPFQGIIKNKLKANTNDEKAAKGYYPHGLKPHPYTDPRPQSTHATLLESTRKLFDSAFSNSQVRRPKARIWAKHFDEILTNKLVVRCEKKSTDLSHLRFKDMNCPECYLLKINAKAKISTNSNKTTKPSAGSSQKSSGQSTKSSYSSTTVLVILVAVGFLLLLILGNDSDNDYKSSSIDSESTKSNQENYVIEEKRIKSYLSEIKTDNKKNKKKLTDTTVTNNQSKKQFEDEYQQKLIDLEQYSSKQDSKDFQSYEEKEDYRSYEKEEEIRIAKEKMLQEHEALQENKGNGTGYVTPCNNVSGSCYGEVKFNDGDSYIGNWLNGTMEGKGSYAFANGDRAEGSFINGLVNGAGIYYFTNGDRVEGSFINGALSGPGIYYFANAPNRGDRAEAPFINGIMSGPGIYYFANAPYRGDRAEAPFIKGTLNGAGTYIRANGERFPITYKDGQPKGKGVLDWLNTKPELVPSKPSFGR